MEKIQKEEIRTVRISHTFYCDVCNKELGTVAELEDGYYKNLGAEDLHIFIPMYGYFTYKKNLCTNCWEAEKDKIVKTLCDLGFEKGV